MGLGEYNAKRDFSKTPEPSGGESTGDVPTFVIQKHAATRLHYDVRFEVDGVMPSFPVPQGPSYDPKVKRLAVHTEDHPLDYQTFEGVIPKGEYGGGEVIIWDRGTYRNISHKGPKPLSMTDAIKGGHFSVFFEGEKLHGGWSFTRTSRKDDDKEQWIMVKRKDEFADPSRDIVKERPESVVSGKTIDDLKGDTGAAQWTRATATWVPPMLATLGDTVPEGDDWIYEPKLDGLRCIAVRNGDEVKLWSRNHLPYDSRFPHVIAAIRALPVDSIVLDGELVAFDGEHASFSALQQRGDDQDRSVLCIFDMLALLGRGITVLPMTERKALLAKAVTPNDVLRIVEPLDGDGETLLANACKNGWEGIVAKRPDATYVSGRSSAWLKLKCTSSQELVIAGWTEPKGSRKGLGALLVGYYDGDDLRFAGKVGTGFSQTLLNELHTKLTKLERKTSPFADVVKEKTAHWASPKLVAQIGFGEWTPDGKLRHPRFVGLRTDKDARAVTRERR